METKKISIIAFCFSVLLASCSQSKQEEVIENKSADKETLAISKKDNIDEKQLTTKEKLVKSLEKPHLLAKRTISINGEKYIVEGEKFIKGTLVRNIHMSEKGRVKGTFVIVTKAVSALEQQFKSKVKIAKDTFRLTPENTDDLMTIYKQLLRNKSIDLVELEIEYSGAKDKAATY